MNPGAETAWPALAGRRALLAIAVGLATSVAWLPGCAPSSGRFALAPQSAPAEEPAEAPASEEAEEAQPSAPPSSASPAPAEPAEPPASPTGGRPSTAGPTAPRPAEPAPTETEPPIILHSETALPSPAPPPFARPRASGGEAAAPERPPLVDKDLRFVRLFYGTNRGVDAACSRSDLVRWNDESDCLPNHFYTGRPAEAPGPLTTAAGTGLTVGTVTVTFPPTHAVGKIERPPKLFVFTLRDEDPDKDILISELHSWSDDYEGWLSEVRAMGREQAFIYVHGYGNTFDQAARRAAQVAYDLDFDLEADFHGLPMMFSWPSRGEVAAYMTDYDASFEAADAFNHFVDMVRERAGVRRVHVIAHSMGNRLVAEALARRGEPSAGAEPVIDQLVLAAPDIWASRFRNRFLRTLPGVAQRVTLYVSDQDRALIASSRFRNDEPRAGQVEGGLLQASAAIDRFDAIDASPLPNDFLGHSYYAQNDSMLSDIYCLLKGTPVTSRPLVVLAETVWRFRGPQELALASANACRPASAPPLVPAPAPPPRRWRLLTLMAILVAIVAVAVVLWLLVRRR